MRLQLADFDVAIIGSGIGGLTCGAFLADYGLKVIVLEQHYQIGGYAHSFKRKKFRFESAVHSVPMGKNGFIMHLLKKLSIDTQITPIPHETMYSASWPGFNYSVPVWYDEILKKLTTDFPHEKEQLHRLFNEMTEFYATFVSSLLSDETIEETDAYHSFISKFLNRSYKDYIDSFFTDENLRRIFYSQWPFGGNAPSKAPIAFYSLMFIVHAIEGSHFLAGGFGTLADALASVITSKGGEVRTKSKVVNLNTVNQTGTSLDLASGETISANLFISNVSPYLLHNEIINPQARHKIWIRRLKNLNSSTSGVTLYLGLKSAIQDILPESLYFWYADSDENIINRINSNEKNIIDHLIFLKTPHGDNQTLAILTYFQKSFSANWKTDKVEIAQQILQKAESILPGLNDQIAYMEIGSPDTFERYTGNTNGAFYGFENTSSIYGEAKLPPKTYLDNLYQVGHWGKPGGGIWNTMYNGYTTAVTIRQERSI
jgi:prolycopene isomerase